MLDPTNCYSHPIASHCIMYLWEALRDSEILGKLFYDEIRFNQLTLKAYECNRNKEEIKKNEYLTLIKEMRTKPKNLAKLKRKFLLQKPNDEGVSLNHSLNLMEESQNSDSMAISNPGFLGEYNPDLYFLDKALAKFIQESAITLELFLLEGKDYKVAYNPLCGISIPYPDNLYDLFEYKRRF